ncbi:MAG: bacteriohemerythrin [Bacteroidales bacterium]
MTNKNEMNNPKKDKLIISYDRFIPAQLYNLVNKKYLTDVELGDQVELKLTIFFSDIRDFTRISEALSPRENFKFINDYFGQFELLIGKYHGIIDKYIGDSLMAIFPNDSDDALDCAIQILKQLKKYNTSRDKLSKPPIVTGIGLNTGFCMFGVVGGHNKMEFTVISDSVNISSRIQELTKSYGVDLLISENTLYSLKDETKYSYRFIDRVILKGKSKPQSVYEVYDHDEAHLKRLKDETKHLFEEALAHYHYKDIPKAKKLLEKCLELNPGDNPAKVYLERCEMFSKTGFHAGAKELKQQVEWSSEFEVGNKEIDEQHFNLFANSIKLLNAIDRGIGNSEIDNLVKFLDNYVINHFKTEEAYLKKHNYPFLDHQHEQHLNFKKAFKQLKNEIKSGSKSKIFIMFKTQTLLVDWIVNHTILEDNHYGKYIRRKHK